MKLELKYNFNDEVYVVWKEKDIINICKGNVVEFSMSEEYGLNYYLDGAIGEEFKEEELVPVTRQDLLLERINKLLGE